MNWWTGSRLRGLGLCALTLAAACARGEARPPTGRGAVGTGNAIPVNVAVIRREAIGREVVLTGPVDPIRTIEVNSRASGTVLAVHAVEGTRVTEGQLLLELDARETTAQLTRARAILTNAEAAYRRSGQMRDAQIVTEAEFEQARAAYDAARSDVDLWATRLEFTRVEAPTGGVVTSKLVEAGSAVSPNQQLFAIADDSLLVVRVQMSELDVVHVRQGDQAQLVLDAQPGAILPGRVRRIFPSADPATRLVPVEVSLTNRSGSPNVRPGFLARVTFLLERRVDVLTAPASAIGSGAAGAMVYRVTGDTLVRQVVTTGLTSGGRVEILSGLSDGDTVVVSGQLGLRAGGRVRIMNDTEVVRSTEEAP